MKEVLLVIELARALLPKMKAEIKLRKSEEGMQEVVALQIQKELEKRLIEEMMERIQLQELEKKVIEEEKIEQKFVMEAEEQKETAHEYGAETEHVYSQDKGAYHVEHPYQQSSGNETCYENK